MKILVAVDASPFSQKALERAVAMASKDGAQLVAVSVAELFYGAHEEYVSGMEDKFVAAAAAAVDAAKALAAKAGVAVTGIVAKGESPADNIIDAARAEGADMIVLGSRSKKGLERFLIGSVAAKVVEHAPCSVLVVR